MIDSGNQLGPMISMDFVRTLGFETNDLDISNRRRFWAVGSLDPLSTDGSVGLTYQGDEYCSTDDFHVLETLIQNYDVLFPLGSDLGCGNRIPAVAATIVAKDDPTDEERKIQEARLREQEKAAEIGRREREQWRAVERRKKEEQKRARRETLQC